MDKLRQCPFCGGEDLTIESHSYRTWFYVRCHLCGLKGPEVNDKETALTVWNSMRFCTQ
ncbi:Lar family restriction alleviation protein [Providencia stuartii]|uniref:Lar family restriction alleviation protein n=1 Tax=Providencia stuartii TaxID=588 RepID=UPI001FF355DD|nr:Lar family restriction alleviation protein [Providencia stuartii]MCK1144552.1 Lar family restriction alleviation protein [Providencia stuartii]